MTYGSLTDAASRIVPNSHARVAQADVMGPGHRNLTSQVIDLWFVRPGDVEAGPEIERCRSLLAGEERARERRLKMPRDRHSFVVTRAFVRTALSRYLSVSPQELVFRPDQYGRPQVLSVGDSGALVFNVAHTRGLIVLGVSSGRKLGVDVENSAASCLSGIAQDFLTPSELAALDRLAPDARHNRHYEYWTLKEAYAKARSLGLALPFKQCSFAFDFERIDFATAPELADPSSRWFFRQFIVDGTIMVAVCGEANKADGTSVRLASLPGFAPAAQPLAISYVRG